MTGDVNLGAPAPLSLVFRRVADDPPEARIDVPANIKIQYRGEARVFRSGVRPRDRAAT